MTKVPKYWNKAKKHLSKKDKIIAKLIKDYRSPSETILTSRRDIFFSLCKSSFKIVFSSIEKMWFKPAKGFRDTEFGKTDYR